MTTATIAMSETTTTRRHLSAGLVMITGLMAACAVQTPARAEPVQPPPGYRQAVPATASKASTICEEPPAPYIEALDFQSKYEGSGDSRDTVNPAAEAAYKAKSLPITAMEKGLVSLVDKGLRSGRTDGLDCAIHWLDTWAEAHALLGPAPNHTGRSLRKWSLGSLSSAYLKLQYSPLQPLAAHHAEAQRIEGWFSAIASHVVTEWPVTDPVEKINNHYYWAAWALMASSVATHRQDLFDQSIAIYRVFETQVDAEGYLPNELRRASRAAGYHNYAMQPLAMIAAFAKANGVDVTPGRNPALSRLARRAEAGLARSPEFQQKTGAAQDSSGLDNASDRAWLEAYCWTVACTAEERALAGTRPLSATRLGGNLTAVFIATGEARP